MITKKELGFINLWANKVPYPGMDYCAETVNKLKQNLELYKNNYMNNKYNISLSNNEEIEVQILQKNICHMLGIDYKNLSGDFFKEFRKKVLDIDPELGLSSFDLLNSLIENMDKVLEYDYNNTAKAINYYKVAIKCDIFSKLSDLSQFNYGCINFDKSKFIENNPSTRFSSESSRFLYTASDEIVSPYFMMGLRKDESKIDSIESDEEIYSSNGSDAYIIETLIAPEECKYFFMDQEVVIPTQVLTDKGGILTKEEASREHKIKLLKEYQSIINQYDINSRINIYGDYLSLLMENERKKIKTK